MAGRLQKSWSRRHPWKARFLGIVLALGLAEVGCRILVGVGLLPYHSYPTSARPQFWDDLSPSWGVWHLPDATLHHVSTCYDVVYRTNSEGMRDPERSRSSAAERRVVVLGDSFVEGYGVAHGERATDLLEARTGVEHLNFGSASDFSTVQQWLLYRDLASRFDHTDVLILLLPFNDARDNDPSRFPPNRYRPYLRRSGSGPLELRYPVAFEDRRRERRSSLAILANTASNHLYLYNVLRSVAHRLGDDPDQWLLQPDGLPSYDSYDDFDVECTLYALEQVHEIAGTRRIHLFTIPTRFDFEAAVNSRDDFRVPRELRAFADARDSVEFTDLLDAFVAHARENGSAYADYVLQCDGHWNALGHRVASDAILAATTRR